ncbi:hypothetical protein DFJ74DRAFT_733049, partial [Hyaloraphidium curvatum]
MPQPAVRRPRGLSLPSASDPRRCRFRVVVDAVRGLLRRSGPPPKCPHRRPRSLLCHTTPPVRRLRADRLRGPREGSTHQVAEGEVEWQRRVSQELHRARGRGRHPSRAVETGQAGRERCRAVRVRRPVVRVTVAAALGQPGQISRPLPPPAPVPVRRPPGAPRRRLDRLPERRIHPRPPRHPLPVCGPLHAPHRRPHRPAAPLPRGLPRPRDERPDKLDGAPLALPPRGAHPSPRRASPGRELVQPRPSPPDLPPPKRGAIGRAQRRTLHAPKAGGPGWLP